MYSFDTYGIHKNALEGNASNENNGCSTYFLRHFD